MKKLYKKYIKCKNTVTRNQIYQEYKTLKNQITQVIKLSKKNHFTRYFTANNNNLRKLWDGIKELVNIKPKNKDWINCIFVNGKTVTAPKEIANNFNLHFTKIADNILSGKRYHGNKHYSVYLTNPIPNSFAFRPCDKLEIELLISKLDINKSTGPNGIPTKILLLIESILSEPLSKIYNNSILTGQYVEKLKFAKTIPIFKKGSRILVSDYRPISLLSNPNKIMEKLVFNRVYEFFEKFNCIYENQYGFRTHHSTVHTLINIH